MRPLIKSKSASGFTLVEMLTVMFIIGVLASLILGIHGFVNGKAARARAEGEIQAITAACESYKADNGTYPRGGPSNSAPVTEGAVTGTVPSLTQSSPPISPMKDGDPTASNYKSASQYLYGELAGDPKFTGAHTNSTDPSQSRTVYLAFRPDQLGLTSGVTIPSNNAVAYLKDPFGNSYGYSTAAATDEELFQQNLQASPGTTRPTPQGFNSTFDLWSTGGRIDKTVNDLVWPRWVKNW